MHVRVGGVWPTVADALRAASRNVRQTGIDRLPGRSILPSGSRPASRAISRARSWYGSGRPIALHLAIAVCRRNPVCFVKLKESFIFMIALAENSSSLRPGLRSLRVASITRCSPPTPTAIRPTHPHTGGRFSGLWNLKARATV
jgi:hypothetical protein